MLRLIPATDLVRGIREIEMHIRNPSELKEEHYLGQSVLKFVGPTAIWSFR